MYILIAKLHYNSFKPQIEDAMTKFNQLLLKHWIDKAQCQCK